MEPPAPQNGPVPKLRFRFWPWLLVAAALVFVCAVRGRLLNLPLERDEGEYAYLGQLILQGVPPYELLYTMKLPGTGAAYALGMLVFGQTSAGIHLTLLLANSLTIVFVFLLGRRLAGDLAGGIAAISYAVMSISPAVVGLAAHATQFVVLFAVPATWLLLRFAADHRPGTLLASGLLFGLAFLMKQQGLCFGGFAVAYLAWQAWRRGDFFSRSFIKRLLIFGTGLILPFALTCLILAWAGVFKQFWFWTITYARQYEGALPLREGIESHLLDHLRQTRDLSMGLWILALAGLPACWRVKPLRPAMLFAAAFWLFSFCGAAAGLYFRGHYFVLLLPAFALLLGFAVAAWRQIMPSKIFPDVFKSLPLIACATILIWVIYYQAPVFFQWPASLVARQLYRDNPFTEAVTVAGQIRAHSLTTARVAVIGSEPEIYFDAQRHSATGYVYLYPLMESQPFALKMQHDMAREIESVQPEFLVQVPYQLSWLQQPDSSHFLLDWSHDYAARFYQPVGMVGYSSSGALISVWGPAATNNAGLTGQCLTIYQLKH